MNPLEPASALALLLVVSKSTGHYWFLMGMETGEDDAMIVRSTIDLAHNLGLTVLAEGVETAAIQDRLRALHCDEAQGYHIARPPPVDDFLAWQARQG